MNDKRKPKGFHSDWGETLLGMRHGATSSGTKVRTIVTKVKVATQ